MLRHLFLSGLILLSACNSSSAKDTRAEPNLFRGEAPHLVLKTTHQDVEFGDKLAIVVTGTLRGYNLGGSDFCLKPEWVVYGSDNQGRLVGTPDVGEPIQCRDHEFTHMYVFTNPGTYRIDLRLRTTGTKIRLADWHFIYVDVGRPEGK